MQFKCVNCFTREWERWWLGWNGIMLASPNRREEESIKSIIWGVFKLVNRIGMSLMLLCYLCVRHLYNGYWIYMMSIFVMEVVPRINHSYAIVLWVISSIPCHALSTCVDLLLHKIVHYIIFSIIFHY